MFAVICKKLRNCSGTFRAVAMGVLLFCLTVVRAFAWWEVGYEGGVDDFGDPVLERKYYESNDDYGAIWFYLDDQDNIEECNMAFECEDFEEVQTSGLCVLSVKEEDGGVFSWKTSYRMNSDGLWHIRLGMLDSIRLYDVFSRNNSVRLIVKDIISGLIFDYGTLDCSDFLTSLFDYDYGFLNGESENQER